MSLRIGGGRNWIRDVSMAVFGTSGDETSGSAAAELD
jgi:hypothetical protein